MRAEGFFLDLRMGFFVGRTVSPYKNRELNWGHTIDISVEPQNGQLVHIELDGEGRVKRIVLSEDVHPMPVVVDALIVREDGLLELVSEDEFIRFSEKK